MIFHLKPLLALLIVAGLVAAGCGPSETAPEKPGDEPDAAEKETETNGTDDQVDEPVAPAAEPPTDPFGEVGGKRFVQVLRDAGEFTKFRGDLIMSELSLETGGPYTILAPTDEAYARLPEGTMERLKNAGKIGPFAKHHILEGKLTAADLAQADAVTTVAGTTLEVTAEGDAVTVGGATVTLRDIEAAGGLAHGVDEVLWSGEE